MTKESVDIKKDGNHLDLIFDHLQDGVLLFDTEGKILSVNPIFSKISGYSPEELRNITLEQIIRYSEKQYTNLLDVFDGKNIAEFPLCSKNKDSDPNLLVTLKIVIEKSTGKKFLLGSIINNNNTSEIENLKRELEGLRINLAKAEEKANEAERASEAKSLFLASMSHEIRTPMNGVLGYLELLEQEVYESKEELNSFISKTRSAAESLLDIINNILDISKIEAGKMELEDIDFSLREVLENAVSIITPLAEEKHLEVSSKIDDTIPWILMGDPFRIRQIFTNLLSNAIKYTPTGNISIDINLQKIEDNHAIILVSVKDTGVGIAKDKIEMLFKPYSQLDKSYNKVYRGTGLGLRLCKEFISLMGGRIAVESKEGEGSDFYFTIKLKMRT